MAIKSIANYGKWTLDEVTALHEKVEEGLAWRTIGNQIGRSTQSIISKARDLGLSQPKYRRRISSEKFEWNRPKPTLANGMNDPKLVQLLLKVK